MYVYVCVVLYYVVGVCWVYCGFVGEELLDGYVEVVGDVE